MTQPQQPIADGTASSNLQYPPVLTLRITGPVFELIRGVLGKLPHDEIGGLCKNLEAQVGEQIRDFNTPKMPPQPEVPTNRAARRRVLKSETVTPIARAKTDKPANT